MTFADAYDPICALQSAWRLIGRSPAPLLVGGMLLTFFGDSPWATFKFDGHHFAHLIPALFGLGLCCGLGWLLLQSWISIGLANATGKTLFLGESRFDDLFESKGRFFDMVLTRVLLWLIGFATAVPVILIVLFAAIGGESLDVDEGLIVLVAVGAVIVWLPIFLYVNLGVSLATMAVAIEGAKPTEALKRSWDIVHGQRLRLFVYWLTLIGLCCCCIGILFTGALAHIAANESYLQLVKPTEPAATPPVMPAAPAQAEPHAPPAPPPPEPTAPPV
jgi:hypothetical protein